MNKTIALIGVGVMGRGIARNLQKTGARLNLFTRNHLNIRDLESATTAIFSDPAEACKNADIIILCLTFDHVVEELVFHKGIMEHARGIIIDFGTTSPELTERIHRAAVKKEIEFLDAPMTGSKMAAEKGTILFMTGASDSLYRKCKFIFDACGSKVIQCGAVGNGQKAKIALNLIIAGMVQIYSEGLILAKKLGINKETMGAIIAESGAKSGISEFKFPYMFKKDFEIHFALKNMNKDLNHAVKQAMNHHINLPLMSSLKGIFDSGIALGYKDEDFCSILKVNERNNNIEI